jgi:hypothetical protein
VYREEFILGESEVGVSLTTEIETNVTLYRHFGYSLLGEVQVAPALTAWGFFRPDTT